jgi:hypothetical protein
MEPQPLSEYLSALELLVLSEHLEGNGTYWRFDAVNPMKVTIEILRWGDGQAPKVLGSIQHESHSLEAVASAAQGVIDSGELPGKVDGYRIVTENGTEFFGWADPAADLFEPSHS